MSLGAHMYTNNTLGHQPNPNALPAPSEADQLYRDWMIFNRWLKYEDDRIAAENGMLTRPLSLGDAPPVSSHGDVETAAVLYHLRRELEDAIMIEENRAKRTAVEKRTNLAPSDAVRYEMRNMPPVPTRTYTLETEHSGNFSRFESLSMSDSTATIRPNMTASPTATSPTGSPQLHQGHFHPIDWGNMSPDLNRSPSASTSRSSFSTSPDSSHLCVPGLGINTAETTPEDHPLRNKHSVSSLATIALGKGALDWTPLCRKVAVERASSKGIEEMRCDIFWRHREDTGITVRCLYKSSSGTKEWIVQHFPATGPSIPLTTTHVDGEISVEFPRSSFGRLEKRCTDIKYSFANANASLPLQNLLYTNNGKDRAELMYDRPIVTISSDKNRPECRNKNIRLWRRTEEQEGPNGPEDVDVLLVLFFTSALPEEKAHWVEEPHYVFQWLDESVYKKNSDKLELTFSKEPGKWSRDKMFKRRKNSKDMPSNLNEETALALRRSSLQRQSTINSVASSSMSIKSSKSSIFGGGKRPRAGNLNRFGYSDLKIEFKCKQDRKDFLAVWRQYVRPLGFMDV